MNEATKIYIDIVLQHIAIEFRAIELEPSAVLEWWRKVITIIFKNKSRLTLIIES